MAVVTYPLNNIGYDDKDVAMYNATRSSGVYAGDDYGIRVTGTDNRVTILPGLAWMRLSKFHGVAVGMREEQEVTLPLPPTSGQRVDAICLQFDANRNKTELVVKSGTEAASPEPPERAQTEALYELQLYHVLRLPDVPVVAAMMVTDVRMDSRYCGLMADAITRVDTDAINQQVRQFLDVLAGLLAEVIGGTQYELKRLTFTNTVVPVTAWSRTGGVGNYPYRAAVSLSGVTSAMLPEVVFSADDATSGMFAPVADSYIGGVYLYAASVPSLPVTVPTITVWR